jgi:hypothetical protein
MKNEPGHIEKHIVRASQSEIAEAAAVVATEQFIREGKAHIEKMNRNSELTMLERIARNELIAEAELTRNLGDKLEWLSDAEKANRIFSMQRPSGEMYYPAFYGAPTYDRQSLEMVCEKLGNPPGGSKYHFFTSKLTFLGIRTPLEALVEGMFTKVLMAAEGFAQN